MLPDRIWKVKAIGLDCSKSMGAHAGAVWDAIVSLNEIDDRIYLYNMETIKNAGPIFSPETFELLGAIARTPTAAFYLAHKSEFKQFVEEPLQQVMHSEASILPPIMRSRLETKRNVFSRFLKNDFGRGGAWSNYWGAFYPKGSRRIADVQLAMWINHHGLGISFFIGDEGTGTRARFLKNCSRYRGDLNQLLGPLIDDPRIVLAYQGKTTLDDEGLVVADKPMSWEDWLDDPGQGNFWAFFSLSLQEAMKTSSQDLTQQAALIHMVMFPLALLAMDDQPLGLIRAYMAGE